MKARLIIFTRCPEAGRVKTRLIPLLGPEGAAQLHLQLATHTLAWANELDSDDSVSVEVYFEGGDRTVMAKCFGDHFRWVRQASGDLGAKLIAATTSGNHPIIVVGTDCPELNADTVREALLLLQTIDVVLGPAHDGGYYLIGLKEPLPALFNDIPWGTDQVCRLTHTIATDRGLSVRLLDVLRDIDRPDDVEWLRHRFPGWFTRS